MKRPLFVALFLGVTGVALACGFPDVTFTDAGDGSEAGFDATLEAGEAGPLEDATADASEDAPEDVRPDVLILGDAGSDVDGGDPCDRDQDGYKAKGGSCGGDDCDDLDARAHPGLTGFFTHAIFPPTNGDWDCSGVVDKQFTDVNQACGLISLGKCVQKTGFAADPKCGTQGTYITECIFENLSCKAVTKLEYQGCR